MPFSSDRKQLLHNTELTILSSHFDDYDETMKDLVRFHEVLSNSRFVHERTFRRRDNHFFLYKLQDLTANWFRATYRTTKTGFIALVGKLRDHSVFYNNSTCAQLAQGRQIAAVLSRFGSEGNGGPLTAKQILTGLVTGTLNKYMERMIWPLWRLGTIGSVGQMRINERRSVRPWPSRVSQDVSISSMVPPYLSLSKTG